MDVLLICENEDCKKQFTRNRSEYNRCKRKGFAVSCSRSCGAVLRNRKHAKGNILNLRVSTTDKFSPFRFIFNQIKNKSKIRGITFTITLTDLINQWDKQQGRCSYSNYQLQFPSNSTVYKKRESNPYFASLDRIDSSKGYEPDNIEFVCVVVNFAKNRFSRDQMVEFFSNFK